MLAESAVRRREGRVRGEYIGDAEARTRRDASTDE
jgi:hypothetical protein